MSRISLRLLEFDLAPRIEVRKSAPIGGDEVSEVGLDGDIENHGSPVVGEEGEGMALAGVEGPGVVPCDVESGGWGGGECPGVGGPGLEGIGVISG